MKRWLFSLTFSGFLLGLCFWLVQKNCDKTAYTVAFFGFALLFFSVHKLRMVALKLASTSDLLRVEGNLMGRRRVSNAPAMVAVGGGTGLSTLLRGIKEYARFSDVPNITAIVTVSDDGGSSGRLRREFKIPPPGDIRNCLVALAETEKLMADLFQYRFHGRGDLRGHSFGNLFITALTEVTGDFEKAIMESSRILAVKGRILPASVDAIILCAELMDGTVLKGETKLSRPIKSAPLKKVFIEPENPKPAAEVINAIKEADIIILGPGSLYTSIVPNLLIPSVAATIANSSAKKIYVCNVMTQPGETDNFTASDHLRVMLDFLGQDGLDYIIVNNGKPPQLLLEKYKKQGAYPVEIDDELEKMFKGKIIEGDLIYSDDLLRHDPQKLARLIMKMGFVI